MLPILTTSPTLTLLLREYPTAIYNPVNTTERNNHFTEHLCSLCAYAVIADGELEIVGEGNPSRTDFLFTGRSISQGHQKSITIAMLMLTAKKVETIFIPVKHKIEAKAVEKQLKLIANFHKEPLITKNEKLFALCLDKLQMDPSTLCNDINIIFTPLLNPAGSDIGNLAKHMLKYRNYMAPNDYVALQRLLHKILGHYFNNFAV